MPTCAITCNVSSQQLSLDSGHVRLLEPRADEFVFELDIDNNESVGFEIGDFVHAGNNYTVTVVATQGGSSQTWTHGNGVSTSSIETSTGVFDLAVTANASGASTLSSGGRIRILHKGKPD